METKDELSVITIAFFDFIESLAIRCEMTDIILSTRAYDEINEAFDDILKHTGVSWQQDSFYKKYGVSKDDLEPHILVHKAKRGFIIFKSTQNSVWEVNAETIKRFIKK